MAGREDGGETAAGTGARGGGRAPAVDAAPGNGDADRSLTLPTDYGQKVPAVDQAARILHHLAGDPRGYATLTEISLAVGIYKSKGRAILSTLCDANLVSRNDQDKTYSLGPGVLALSRAFLDHTDLGRVAAPYLEELAVSTGTCAFVAVIRGPEVFVVASREAPDGIGVSIRVGYHFPLTFGSIGKAIGAFLPDDELETILSRPPLYFHGRPNAGTPTDMDAVRADLLEAREKGYGVDLGRVQAGVHAVCAPLLGNREPYRPQGVLTLIGTFPAEAAAAHGERVAAKAREMSASFGPLLRGGA